MSLGVRIKEAREAAGLSQQALGDKLEVSRSAVAQWESGANAPTMDKVQAIAIALNRPAGWLLDGIEPSNVAPANNPTPFPNELLKDVKVLGTAVGGDNGDFTFSGETIDYVRRLPGIAHNRAVYCLYVRGTSMVPWREEGEMIYVDPNRPPRNGDYVVVEMKPKSAGEPGPAYVKRFLARAGNKLKLLQLNPKKEIEIPMEQVLRIHRVLTLAELTGV